VVITNQKNYFVKSLPKMKAYSVVLTGSYKHLPTAWAAQMMHQRSKKFKSHKKIPPFEIYLNDPMNVPEAQLKTKVMFPVTGSP
jgi:effector-binding domain-containing protein